LTLVYSFTIAEHFTSNLLESEVVFTVVQSDSQSTQLQYQ